jgi:hypothetical protein
MNVDANLHVTAIGANKRDDGLPEALLAVLHVGVSIFQRRSP